MPSPGSMNEARSIETLNGELLKIRYKNQNGWCIGEARLNHGCETVVGELAEIPQRQALIFYGYWEAHPKYGLQFHVQATRSPDPLAGPGMVRYLATAHCPHLGPKTAKKLADAFEAETLDILRSDPERVATLPGISLDRARQWKQFFVDQQGADDIIVWLLQWDIDPSVARRLYREYGAGAMERVRANPYNLTQDTWGVGFRTADRMALSMGWGSLSAERLEAVWRFGLETALNQGDCYQTTDQLTEQVVALLDDQDGEAVRKALEAIRERLTQLPDVMADDERWRLRWVHRLEESLAMALRNHPSRAPKASAVDWAWLEAETGVTYATAQREALVGALNASFSIVTGGPGTGKTTILNGLLVWLTRRQGVASNRIALAAPTARAAQRMTQLTGHDAQTIHRLLGWSPPERGFIKMAGNPVDADWLIIDEVSMVDLPLAHALWQATAPTTRVLWIGDEHQLPSVGPGSILKDVIHSGRFPIYRLTQNFRSTSGITVAAHDLLAHRVPKSNLDVTIVRHQKGDDKLAVQQEILEQILLLHRRGTPWEAIQVLTPIRRGRLGTDGLNPLLRDLMNPEHAGQSRFIAKGGLAFREGDRLMQTKNAYGKNVFNGDMGVVVAIRPDLAEDDDDDRLWVQFADQTVGFSAEEAYTLRLAYATTVHKSQGSEYPIVLFPLFYDAYVMLHRNLVYTALTRAKERLWLYTEASALWLALKRGDGAERQTGLTEKIRI